MNESKENFVGLWFGVGLTLVVLGIDQYVTLMNHPATTYFFNSVLVILFFIGSIYGYKLPSWLKVFCTGVFFIWGIYTSLFGRSVGVNLTYENIVWCLGMFAALSFLVLIPLCRLWSGKVRIRVLLLFPVVSILSALVLASIEERVFVMVYSEGVGPTKRWSINSSWMAYDTALSPESGIKVLRGGD